MLLKKIFSILFCVLLVLSLIACSQTTTVVEYVVDEQEVNQMDSNKAQEDTESAPEEAKESDSKESTEAETTETTLDTRTLKMNGKNFVAEFSEESTSGLYGSKMRNVLVFENEDKTVRYEFDKDSGELLWAKFTNKVDDEKKITEEKARKIADTFLKDNCSKEEYTFKSVKTINSSGYFVSYTKVNENDSLDGIVVIVRFDGTIGQYLIGGSGLPNIEVDYDMLDKFMDKRVKQDFGNDIIYTITGRSSALKDTNLSYFNTKPNQLYVAYYMKLNIKYEGYVMPGAEIPDYTEYSYYIPITESGDIDKSIPIERSMMYLM